VNNDEIREKLLQLIREFDTAMLVTVSQAGELRSRPMAIAELDVQGNLWFVTSAETAKVCEIDQHPTVNLTLQGTSKFVSLTGTASLTQDPERVRSLWREAWRVWFPEGPTQSDLLLLQVKPTLGEYWDNRGGRGLRFLWEAAKAYTSGERLDERLGENSHGKTRLREQPTHP
jgi:general stress protein 26